MNADIYAILLLLVVAWPLLLAIPALHSRLPWSRHLAIIPAAMLTVLPGDASLELSWLLFGTGFAVNSETRWILLMTVAIWFTAATLSKPSMRDHGNHATPFFFLTLTGNLGAILATDLISFFSFATLMGYSFYGLLIQDSNDEVRRAGRLYIIFLVVADLLLFEALLLAAFTTEDLRYEAVREAMAGASSLQFYLWMVLIGFALKAGVWPAHLWLLATYRSVQRSTALLLMGVPVAMGLLGAVRWLPLGEFDIQGTSEVIQIMGIVAFLYAAQKLIRRPALKILPAWITIAVTGMFIAALGAGLAHPAIWRQYEYLSYPFIAFMGILLATLTFFTSRLQDSPQSINLPSPRMAAFHLWVARCFNTLQRWTKESLFGFQSYWSSTWLKTLKQIQRMLDWQKPEGFVGEWSARITLFVLVGLALAWLAA